MTAPTGVVPWPIMLVAGVDHSQVALECAKAAGSDLVGAASWVPVGRDYPDTLLPAAGFEIVEHDGTFRSILAATTAVVDAAEQSEADLPHLLVVDSVSPLWALLADDAAATLTERVRAHGFPVTAAGHEIPRDLWRERSQRWHRFLNVVRRHPGPVILTAYLDEVPLVNEAGDRTTGTRWEIQAEKNLPRSVSCVVQHRGAGRPVLSGVAGVAGLQPDDVDEHLTIDELWRRLGLDDTTVPRPRRHATTVPVGMGAERDQLLHEIRTAADLAGVPRQEVVAGWANSHGGQHINQATDLDELERTRDALLSRRATPAGDDA